MLSHYPEAHSSKKHPRVRGVDCHKSLAKIMGFPLAWCKTHGKVEGTSEPDLLIKKVDMKIMCK